MRAWKRHLKESACRPLSAWLLYALVTMLLWGVWGALAGLPSEHGWPETLNYAVWALTMIPPAIVVLRRSGQPLQRSPRAVALGLAIGLLGAGGQLLLFHAVRVGPPYLIFPIISLSPAVTILLSYALLGERTGRLGVLGIVSRCWRCRCSTTAPTVSRRAMASGLRSPLRSWWHGACRHTSSSWPMPAWTPPASSST